ncbi:MAG: hypothetical protein M1839_002843 [Geoglossum umbratile]|nr:MAG: hypothetical protein M1839_002843 [Geoglossum umbratile]
MTSTPTARRFIFTQVILVILSLASRCTTLNLVVGHSVKGRALSVYDVFSWSGYHDLPGCVKWCFSGCQENGTSTAYEDCVRFVPSNASSNYPGFVIALGCATPRCICGSSQIYQRSVRKVYECALRYCQAALGDLDYQSPDVESIIQVVSGFCIEEGLFQPNWTVVLDPGPNATATIGQSHNVTESPTPGTKGLSLSDKIGLGIGVPCAVAAVFAIPVSIIHYFQRRKPQPPNPPPSQPATFELQSITNNAAPAEPETIPPP